MRQFNTAFNGSTDIEDDDDGGYPLTTDTNPTLFQPCKQVTIYNNTGRTIEFSTDSDVWCPIPDKTSVPIGEIDHTSDVRLRSSGTVTVTWRAQR